jgi:hypothetical protein
MRRLPTRRDRLATALRWAVMPLLSPTPNGAVTDGDDGGFDPRWLTAGDRWLLRSTKRSEQRLWEDSRIAPARWARSAPGSIPVGL